MIPSSPTASRPPAECLVSVLVALELRLDREATSRAMALLRPHWCIHAVEPAELDAQIAALRPLAVLCSALTEVVVERVPIWFLEHDGEPSRYAASIDDADAGFHSVGFLDILEVIDSRAE